MRDCDEDPENSHWQYGYRYLRWSDTFHDPFTGNAHSKTTDTLTGPGVNYLFNAESSHSAYAGVSLLKWSRTEPPCWSLPQAIRNLRQTSISVAVS